MNPKFSFKTLVGNGRRELHLSELHYTGFNHLNILLDPFTLLAGYPIREGVQLGITADYRERTTTKGIEINIYTPSFLVPEGSRNKLFLPEYSTKLPEEPQNEANLPASVAREYLEGLAKDYPITRTPEETFAELVKEASTLEATKKFQEYMDQVQLFKGGGLKLFDTYNHLFCDCLVTNNSVLLKERGKNRYIQDALILSWEEINPFLEQFMIGHGLFISSPRYSSLGAPIYGLDSATFYAMTDAGFQKYQGLMSWIQKQPASERASNYFRVALFHRYQFMLHSRAKIHFEMFQSRKGGLYEKKTAHYFNASYHLNMFYLMLWGFLDNLAWSFNFLLGLGFNDMDEKGRTKCTFASKHYRRTLAKIDPAMSAVIHSPEFQTWIDDLKIKRHPAAHREPLYLSTVLKEDMSPLGDTLIVSNKDSRSVMFDALNHLEYDFDKLARFMDAVCERFDATQR